MDLNRMSEHFHKFRETADWKEFELALEKLLKSPACAEFERSVAPATGKMDHDDLFDLLAGFIRSAEPLPPNTVLTKVAYKEIYEYDDRPTMTFDEAPTTVYIQIGDKTFQE